MKTFLILMALSLSLPINGQHVPLDNELVILYDKPDLLDIIEGQEGIGPNIYALRLLFAEIGMPKSMLYIPTARMNLMIDEAQPACLLFKLKNHEREQKYLFSKPISLHMGRRLYQQTQSASIASEHFNSQGEIKSVAELMAARPKDHIIVVPGFSYGNLLDRQIEAISQHQKIQAFAQDVHSTQPAMFFNNRADFALLSSLAVKGYSDYDPNITYRSYPIADNNRPITVHAMCNKTQAASAWLEQINSALPKIYQHPLYTQIYVQDYQGDELDMIQRTLREYTDVDHE